MKMISSPVAMLFIQWCEVAFFSVACSTWKMMQTQETDMDQRKTQIITIVYQAPQWKRTHCYECYDNAHVIH